MLVSSSSDDCSDVLVDDGSTRTSGRVSGTQHVVGGNRSVGPTYIPGRSNTCSTGVLRLYCSSMLNCRSAGALLDLNLTDDEEVLLGGARRSCCGARAAAAATGEGAVEQHERKRRRATSVASERKRIMRGVVRVVGWPSLPSLECCRASCKRSSSSSGGVPGRCSCRAGRERGPHTIYLNLIRVTHSPPPDTLQRVSRLRPCHCAITARYGSRVKRVLR